jgi:hypothetical protein
MPFEPPVTRATVDVRSKLVLLVDSGMISLWRASDDGAFSKS